MAPPMTHVDVVLEDESGGLEALVTPGTSIERIAGGLLFTEGPVWRGDHLLFSDIPNDRTCRWRELPEGPELTTFATRVGRTNGLSLGADGALIGCAHEARAVLRFDEDGSATPIATHFDGKRLNSPNDLAARANGDIYFTDPPYGIVDLGSEAGELDFNGLFLLRPDGSITLASDRFMRPNGLAFSPDQSVLYVGDSGGPRDVWAFDVADDGSLANERLFADLDLSDEPRNPDGMKCDAVGRLWTTGPGGIWVVEPDGQVHGRIVPPEHPANLAWGGPDWTILYITAGTSVYRLQTNVTGIPVPHLPT